MKVHMTRVPEYLASSSVFWQSLRTVGTRGSSIFIFIAVSPCIIACVLSFNNWFPSHADPLPRPSAQLLFLLFLLSSS